MSLAWLKKWLAAGIVSLWQATKRIDWIELSRRAFLLFCHLLRIFGILVEKVAELVRRYPRASFDVIVGSTFATFLVLLMIPAPPSDLELGSDLDCLALNIYHEARGETEEGQVAVAQVVMNRVAHERFPENICEVIKQGGEWPRGYCQFSWWCDGRKDTPEEGKSWTASRDLAREVLHGKHKDPTKGALWYHATHVSPAWRKAFQEGPTIGKHIFYRPKPKS